MSCPYCGAFGDCPHWESEYNVWSKMTDTPKFCTWEYDHFYDYWETSCGDAYQIVDGTPTDNKMKFCPYCGKELVEQQINKEEIENAD